jgi:hypothetical protein
VRRFLPELIDLIWTRAIDPGKVFDLELPLEEAAEGYRAMDARSRCSCGSRRARNSGYPPLMRRYGQRPMAAVRVQGRRRRHHDALEVRRDVDADDRRDAAPWPNGSRRADQLTLAWLDMLIHTDDNRDRPRHRQTAISTARRPRRPLPHGSS